MILACGTVPVGIGFLVAGGVAIVASVLATHAEDREGPFGAVVHAVSSAVMVPAFLACVALALLTIAHVDADDPRPQPTSAPSETIEAPGPECNDYGLPKLC